MNHTEFMNLHATFVTSKQTYVVEIEKSSKMLAECTVRPLTLKKRLKLTAQGIIEHTAHLTYLGAKSLLLEAARLGYGFFN